MRTIATYILVILTFSTIECALRALSGAYASSQVAGEVFLTAFCASVCLGIIASPCHLFYSEPKHKQSKHPSTARCALATYIAVVILGHGDFLRSLTTMRGLFIASMGIATVGVIGFVIVRVLRHITGIENRQAWISAAIFTVAIYTMIVASKLSAGWPMLVALIIGTASLASTTYSLTTSSRHKISLSIVTYLACTASLALLANVKTTPSGDYNTDRPNVLLVTIDTLRSDHVGCYGYQSASTPTLDALANEGCLFEDAVSNAVVTGPSHMTILSGLLISQHGAMSNGTKFPATIPTLADVLSDHGYKTSAFVSGWTLNDAMTGLASHFDYYDDDLNRMRWIRDDALDLQLIRFITRIFNGMDLDWHSNDRPASVTNDRLLDWMSRNKETPFFTWLHYFDPHLPYEAPAPYDRMHDPNYKGPAKGLWYNLGPAQRSTIANDPRNMKHMLALYDGEISYADQQLGRVLDFLKKNKLDDNLLLIVTSDHGESMGEHDIFFGRQLYEPSLRVPLMIKLPGITSPASRVKQQVSLVDITPTILDALGVKNTPPMTGRSLIPLMTGQETSSDIPAIATRVSHNGNPFTQWSVRQAKKKLIWKSSRWINFTRQSESKSLYDLGEDPEELINLGETNQDLFYPLMQTLQSFRMAPIQQGRQSHLKEDIERLKALGYVGD